MADWQLRVLKEYSEAGSSIVERWFSFWFPFLAALMVSLIVLVFSSKPSATTNTTGTAPATVVAQLSLLVPIVCLAVVMVIIYGKLRENTKRSMRRAKLIEDALMELADGRPIPSSKFLQTLRELTENRESAE
jgi:cellobiose-specific phosphotransferase system component IIC